MLEKPCPSILKGLKEIGSIGSIDDGELDEGIVGSKIIQECFCFLDGNDEYLFHGNHSAEAFLNIFSEFKLSKENEYYRKMLDLLFHTKPEDSFYEKGISKVGRVLEEQGHSGINTIRAAALVHADIGYQEYFLDEIQHSMDVFAGVSGYADVNDFAYEKKGRWIYKKGRLFPDFYNLKLLAFSDVWKNEENIRSIKKAFSAIRRMEPFPHIYLEHKGQIIAPGSYLMHEFNVDYSRCCDDKKAEWLKRNVWLSRMGMIFELPMVMENMTHDENEIVRQRIEKRNHFMKWGCYPGLALENDWRSDARRMNDVSYRMLQIRHYMATIT
jgi:hypothetical protein